MKPIFVQTLVVGVGLLGGSTGLAARRSSVGGRVVGVGRSETKLRRAVELGAVDTFATDWKSALAFGADVSPNETTLLIFAAPVETNLRELTEFWRVREELGATNRRFLISDVGSVKGAFSRAAFELTRMSGNDDRNDRDRLRVGVVPAHPIAGSDKSGVENASADLFVGKLTILTPWTTAAERRAAVEKGSARPLDDFSILAPNGTSKTASETFSTSARPALREKISVCVGDGELASNVAAVRDFWRALGCRVVETSADEHDRVLANVSHFPNLISVLATSVVPEDEFPFSGTGFRDVSRLAGGNPDVWTEIFGENRVATLEALERLEENVVRWKSFLKEDDRNSIFTFLQETKKKRDALGS